jgi:HEAT repeat protein
MICRVLTQNAESLLDGKIIQNVIDEMDGEKFECVVGSIRFLENSQGVEDPESLPSIKEAVGRIGDLLMVSDRGKQLQQKKLDKETLDTEVTEMRITDVTALIEPILLRDEKAILDKSLMAILPRIIDRLNREEDYYKVETLIQRLTESLLSADRNVRDSASVTLEKAINALPFEQQIGIIHELSETLIQWITLETSATSAYANICRKLKVWVEALIRNKQLAAGIPLINTFHKIDASVLDKNDAIRSVVSDIIRELAEQNLLDILLEEFLEGEEKNRKAAGHILGRLGDSSLNRLLDVLRESDDSHVRVRILHIFSEIGTPGISVITERIAHEEPWYFLRNLAYMLGRIPNNTVATALEPLLLHENKKVQQEAMKSLYRAGDSERGPILLSILGDVDEPMQADVTEMLGNLKYSPAIPCLTDMIRMRPLITTLSRIDLEEKICVALGKIGSQEAMPVLTEISKPKGLLALTPYHEKVKYAAIKALEQFG